MANYGLDMTITRQPLGFCYGDDVTGPMPEIRTLDQIRPSLRNPDCEGPEQVYAIAMDVARLADRPELEKRMLLFGVVTYAAGTLGDEPVRSQGHVHRISQHSGWSPPELYEIWQGKRLSTCRSMLTTIRDVVLRCSRGRVKRYWSLPDGVMRRFRPRPMSR